MGFWHSTARPEKAEKRDRESGSEKKFGLQVHGSMQMEWNSPRDPFYCLLRIALMSQGGPTVFYYGNKSILK